MTDETAQPETVATMLAPYATQAAANNYKLPEIPGLDIHKDDRTGLDYFYVDDQAAGMAPTAVAAAATPHPTGRFGPLPMRTNSDKLLYGTGAAYASGMVLGGVLGLYRGLRNPALRGAPAKLKVNAVLNSTTRYGPWLGNAWGMLTFMWTGLDATLSYVRGTDDYYNHVGAAFATGAVFKSTAGVRPALLMGSVLSAVVGGYGLWSESSGLVEAVRGRVSSGGSVQAAGAS